MPSASAIAASLPDWMITERMRFSTDTLLLSSANMVEPPDDAPPVRQAFSEMKNSSVQLSLPLRDLVEDDGDRHELGHAGRLHRLVGVLVEEQRAGLVVHQDRELGLGVEILGVRDRRHEGQRAATGATRKASARQRIPGAAPEFGASVSLIQNEARKAKFSRER